MSEISVLLILFSAVFFLKLSKVIKVSWWIICLWIAVCIFAMLIYHSIINPRSAASVWD